MFFRRQKKSFSLTLFDDDTDESDEEREFTKAFISMLSNDDSRSGDEDQMLNK